MPHSHGYRARTRHMFSRGFRQHGGIIKLSTYMIPYKVGDYVDIKANGAVHKGMPHKFYHGKTGVVFNITKSALGIIINKRVGNRYVEKRISVRVEHLKPSKCRDDFLERIKQSAVARAESKDGGARVSLKRTPLLPRAAHIIEVSSEPELVRPIPYECKFLFYFNNFSTHLNHFTNKYFNRFCLFICSLVHNYVHLRLFLAV